MVRRIIAPTLALSLFFSACSSEPPPISLAQKWNNAISRYNLIPIYPMQEDVQIGDVFAYIPPIDDAKGSQASTWLNRLGSARIDALMTGLETQYCQRLRLEPATSDTPKTATPSGTDGAAPKADSAVTVPAASIETTTSVNGVSSTQKITVPATKAAVDKPKTPTTPTAAAKKKTGDTVPPAPPSPDYTLRCPPKLKAAQTGTAATGAAAAAYAFDIQQMGAKSDFRARRVELPEISVASVTDAELAVDVPIQGFFAKLGGGTSSSVALDISLSGIEEIHLPFEAEITLYDKEKPSFLAQHFPPGILLAYLYQKQPGLLRAACFVDPAALNASDMQILVANQVVYAHAINYSYKSSSTVAGQLGVALASSAAPKPATTAASTTAGTSVTTTVSNSNGAATPSGTTSPGATPQAAPQSDAQSALSQESARLAALTGSLSGAGGALQIGIGRSGNITLSDKFDTPMAFGIGDVLAYSPSDLLKTYRKVARAALTGKTLTAEDIQNAALIRTSVEENYETYCTDLLSEKKAEDLTLVEYVETASDTDVQQHAPSAKPRRFRLFDGLPHN